MDARLREAVRMGFRYALVPKSNLLRPHERLPLTAFPVRHAHEAISMALAHEEEQA